jgi:hypothetical protein
MESKKLLVILIISCVLVTMCFQTTEAQHMRWGREFSDKNPEARSMKEFLQRDANNKKRGKFTHFSRFEAFVIESNTPSGTWMHFIPSLLH